MGSNTVKAHGAERHGDVLFFKTESLVLVTDPENANYDPTHDPKSPVYIPIERLENMVLNIMEFGVIEPGVIRKNGMRDDGTPIVELADGRTRYRCLVEANKRLKRGGKETHLYPAVSNKKGGDDNEWRELGVFLNSQRKEESLLVKVDQARRLYSSNGGNIARIASLMNVSSQTIRNWLHLAECVPVVQEAVAAGTVPMMVASKLRDLPRADQPDALKKLQEEVKLAGGDKVKGRAAHDALAKVTGRENNRPPPMRTRKEVDELAKLVGKMAVADAPSAKLVLQWMLGDDVASVVRIIERARAEQAEKDGE